MVCVVKHLIFRRGDVDRLVALCPVLLLCRDFLSKVEDTRVSALGHLPFELKLEVLELVREDDISAFSGLAFAAAGSRELEATVLD